MTQVTLEQAIEIAIAHYNSGQLQQAEAVSRQLLAHDPHCADALHLLGLIAHQVHHPDAAALIRRAIALQPQNALAYGNLGLVLQAQGHLDEAFECRRQALALQPDSPDANYNLGYAFHVRGEMNDAIACYRRAISLRPDYLAAYLNLGAALEGNGEPEEGIAMYRRALALRPDYPEALSNLGNALWTLGQLDEAMTCCQQAIALRPDYPEAIMNLGNVHVAQGKFAEAVECYRRAVALRPDYPDAHSNLSMALLTLGQYEEGWREHEWRWRKGSFPSVRRNFTQPQWNGADLAGLTVLIHAEQGLGDTLQFVRLVPEALRRGGRVVLEVQRSLLQLCKISPELSAAEILEKDETGAPPPISFDVHLPLLSLPLVLGMKDPNRVPGSAPYLHADPEHPFDRSMLAAEEGVLKVGLVWSGGPHPKDRSIALPRLAPLAQPGVRLFSLQLGEAAQQLRRLPAGMELTNLSEQMVDFADTAAILAELDLLICVDTAIAHLAGAMGRPVWVMLKYSADFRWLLEREDSPWYPTMRLFRQKTIGDWDEVVDRVAAELSKSAQARNPEA